MATSVALNGDMDDVTARLILDLQLQDSRELFEASHAKGKNVAGSALSDFQVALQLNQEEVEKAVTILSDRQMTRSIFQAVRADAELLASSITQEQQAWNDRRVAHRLGGVAPPPLAIEAATPESEVDDRLLDVMVSDIPNLANHNPLNPSF